MATDTKLINSSLEDTFWRDMGALPMVVDMMKTGIQINPEAFRELSAYFQIKMEELQSYILCLAGKDFDLGSPQQVGRVLFDDLKLKKIKGYSTDDKKVLSILKDAHPIVPLIREWRGYQKLKSTYSDPMPDRAKEDGRIHATFRITRTDTGRLSSSNPNVMAQPVRNEEAIKIRRGFIAKPGCKLVSGDYSQLEMRILAHMSEDPTLIRIFRSGEDVHAITASEMWNIPVEDLHPKKHRYPAKRINYLIAYGGGAHGLFNQFKQDGVNGYSLQDCQDMINRWYEIYDKVKSNYIIPILQFCRKNGYVKTLFGRIRYLPAIRSPNKWMQAEAERMAINTPIQGTASDIMKEAMRLLVPVYKELQTWGYIEPLLQIHDDLVWEIEDNLIDVAIPMIKTVMEHAVQLTVPTPIDPKVGESWGDMKKWTPTMS
jgi:DNA polymerase I